MGAGDFIKKPDRRFKLVVLIQGLWVTTLIILAIWWGTLLKQQSDEIALLQAQLGVPENQIQGRLERTIRMVESESGAFIILILITNGVLIFFFARDTRRSKSLEAFFASITHELRTPLTSIRLQAEALQDIEDNPKHRPYIERLLQDVSRLEGQVQQTLELARIEGGGILSLQSIRIKNFIQQRVLPIYALQEKKLTLDLSVGEAHIQADAQALTIIFRNIIDNAIKYTQSEPAKLSIRGELRSGFYFLEFNHLNSSFSGERRHLGRLFYRGENSQGAGVGLYLIDTLMKKMKGSADFAPNGSQFSTHLSFRVEAIEVTS